jgi:DNA (cytosine-5)-methyltransferase 1
MTWHTNISSTPSTSSAGAGGGILADLLLGHNPIGACEIEPYPRDVLLARQRDGILPNFPIWDDVCTLDGTPWRGTVDVLCGGFPCQDISAAGKGAGITGERSGLWKEYARLIGEMRPRFVFAENSPLLRTRGLGVVLEDLASLGYNARWGVLGARDVGAPHKRDRMWVLAYANNNGNSPTKESKSIAQGSNSGTPRPKQTIEPSGLCASRTNGSMEGSPEELAYAMHAGLQGDQCPRGLDSQGRQESDGSTSECGGLWWHTDPAESPTEPVVGRVANGVANRVDRLKAIGNGQVSQCAAMAFSILSGGLI